MLWGGCFVQITIIPQNFHTSVGKIQFSRFRFSARNFSLLFQLFTFNFCAKLFKFLLADSDFHASAFQVSTFQVSTDKFQLSRFCFSDSNFQVSADKFQFSRFCFVSFCGNKCLFSNCFHLRNFGTTAPQRLGTTAGLGLN